MANIADNVRKARKKAGLSQDKLARKADIAYNTVVKIESGENNNPTIETLRSIAKALSVDLNDLI
ncbi:MAG: helix-turn-helix transcriptional regulator [Candidatus Pacebacteria bacterium]|jgi:transcriptional regulator with XRE-family HTH domain|nr:DNA-binding protein [Parcubacteria group bacterium]MDP6249729.1 helix-turn-helix transcriptional regulator [Candidatus Paceibacterota bacterium]MDP7159549.1 helix-turn-helix transcriptional regulator [Candidatus Paceibacterota bacterium]MDP7366268.1 helix-turn-helix transcriptional regulator [Candidatus Paceibacterota bacterium]MDP7466157.1 helix-turn-helix transcriptional regulator [Candidatus Paceibacterota bacterium]